ncbi:hypothetical protein Tco_1277839, partial [Tanacetum coccineum]
LPLRKLYRGTSELVEDSKEDDDKEIEESLDSNSVSEDTKDEGPTVEDEDPATEDEGLAIGSRAPGHSVESNGLGLEEEEEVVPGGQQQIVSVTGTVVSAPLRLGYGALRRQELALEEDHVYNPKDDMVYIDVPAYPPPAPPSLEWTSGSLPISPSPTIVPSPVSSPIISLTVPSPVATPATTETKGFLTEPAQLEELSPALFEWYNRNIGELFTRSRAVRDEIFSQRYQFRSLEYEQERVAMTFGVIWRPVLALKSWAGQTDAQRAAL